MTATPMSRRLVAAGLVVLGLGFLGGAGFVWVTNDLGHFGQATYAVAGPQAADLETQSTVPEDAKVVAYADLPARAQTAFDAARRGEGLTLWQKDDRRAIEVLSAHAGGFIEYRGEYYEYVLLVGHRGTEYWHQGLLAFVGALAGGLLLLGAGGRDALADRPAG